MAVIRCPYCNNEIEYTLPVGRKPLDISLTIICEMLQTYCSGSCRYEAVCRTADYFGCSPAYIYKRLKDAGTTVEEALMGRVPDTIQ